MATVDITKLKTVLIPLDDIQLDRSENFRDQGKGSQQYDVDALLDDLLMIGQQVPILLWKDAGGKLHGLRGFRRTAALQLAKERGLSFGPAAGTQAGKPVTHAIAQVITTPLTALDKLLLKIDTAGVRALDPVSFQLLVDESFAAGMTEADTAVRLYEMLRQFYPTGREVAPVDPAKPGDDKRFRTEALERYKGTLQGLKQIARAPTMLRERWFEQLRTNAKLIKRAVAVNLSTIYQDEKSAGNGDINPDNPGPKFMKAWSGFLADFAKGNAVDEHGNPVKRAKAKAMLTNAEVAAKLESANSLIVQNVLKFVLNKMVTEHFAEFDAACLAAEKVMPRDAVASILNIVAMARVGPATEATGEDSTPSDLESSSPDDDSPPDADGDDNAPAVDAA